MGGGGCGGKMTGRERWENAGGALRNAPPLGYP